MPCTTSTTGRAGVSGGKNTGFSAAAALVVASVTASAKARRIVGVLQRWRASFVARLARKEREHRVARRHAFVEHTVHRVDDRHVDAENARKLARGTRRRDAFGDVSE